MKRLMALALACALLLFPAQAFAREGVEVRLSVSTHTTVPDTSLNGYTYTDEGGTVSRVSLTDEDDLCIDCGGTEQTVENSDLVTGKVPDNADTLNAAGVYAYEYEGSGKAYSTNAEEFFDSEGKPGLEGIPANKDDIINDRQTAEALLEQCGIASANGTEYLILVSDTSVRGDKSVQSAPVVTDEGSQEGYLVTLSATATGGASVFSATETGYTVDVANRASIVLTLDITRSMDNDISDGEKKWDVLKHAASEFVRTVFDTQGEGSEFTCKNPGIALTLVVYSGGNNDTVARTVGKYTGAEGASELLSLFAADKSRKSFTGGESMLVSGGTNAEAGYTQTHLEVNKLISSGVSASDISAVFMTDGESNSYLDGSGNSTGYSTANEIKAGEKAAESALELLSTGVTLYNIVINNDADKIKSSIAPYMDPEFSSGGKDGYFARRLKELADSNAPEYALIDGSNVDYIAATTAQEIISTYTVIATQIANKAIKAACVARDARVVDVVPACFDVITDPDCKSIRVIGKDGEGNTVIEWEAGDLQNNKEKSAGYYIVRNKACFNEYSYGTSYANESAVLYFKPLNDLSSQKAVILTRPVILTAPAAFDDDVTETFGKTFGFSVKDDALARDTFFLKRDCDEKDKLEAKDTTVSNTFISNVLDVSTGTLTQDGDGFVIDTVYGRVRIAPDGEVTFTPVSKWLDAWGESVSVDFDYLLSYLYGLPENTLGMDADNGTLSAKAHARITLIRSDEDTDPPAVTPTDPNTPTNPASGNIPQYPVVTSGTPGTPGTPGTGSPVSALPATVTLLCAIASIVAAGRKK